MLCGLKSRQASEHVKCYKTSVIFYVNDILSLFVNGFESQREELQKDKCWHSYSKALACPRATYLYWPLIFLYFLFLFSAQVCTWVFVGVNDFGWSCRWFRTISSYARGLSSSTPALGTFSWKFCCNFSSQLVLFLYHCCTMMSWYEEKVTAADWFHLSVWWL